MPCSEKRFAHQIRALVLLHGRGRESAAAVEFAREADRLDGLDLFDATFGLNVLVDEFFGGLRRERKRSGTTLPPAQSLHDAWERTPVVWDLDKGTRRNSTLHGSRRACQALVSESAFSVKQSFTDARHGRLVSCLSRPWRAPSRRSTRGHAGRPDTSCASDNLSCESTKIFVDTTNAFVVSSFP